MSIQRPPFAPDMSGEEFRAHYWYKDELAAICRQNGLSSSGTKAELEERIVHLLIGETVHNQRAKTTQQRRKQRSGPITLQTRLIPEGFRFNQEARAFFQEYYGVNKFSFTKEMAAALRDAEKRNDQEMTVADLIAVYDSSRQKNHTKANPPTAEDKTYQWNGFVKEFHADPQSKQWKNKLEIAAFLWRKVRDRKGEKRYTPALLEEFKDEIEQFAKPASGGSTDQRMPE
ncbi:SAP domain-containing protein [Brevibacillus humidisoli]|uniref:SAP domain-containing protein n=1 Tax=Brevibacillus humidisoli TaxID=2895522 RepID=UPI001E29317C|nr:SAP domain-containing protein [Brevibacillus humidisoli]UFJ39869.1 SAP domain-containing protein [Brevibacillus humidisoli]